LNPQQAEQFGYEFQRMIIDAKDSGRESLVYASPDEALRVYGPSRIDAGSVGDSVVFRVLHPSSSPWTVDATLDGETVEARIVNARGVSTVSETLRLNTAAVRKASADGFLVLTFQSKARVERIAIPVNGVGPRVAVDGPHLIYLPRDVTKLPDYRGRTFTWRVSNPAKRDITVALDEAPQSLGTARGSADSSPGSRLVLSSSQSTPTLVEYSAMGAALDKPGEYRIVVRDQNARAIATLPVSVRNEPLETEGSISASCTVQDTYSVEKNFGVTFAKAFYCIQVVMYNTYDKPVTVTASSLRLPIDFVIKLEPQPGSVSLDYVRRLDWARKRQEYLIDYNGQVYVVFNSPRTPMNFTAVLNVFEFNKDHDPSQVFINILKGAGVVAAAVPAFSSVGSSYSPIVSFIQGPVTATLEDLLLHDLVTHLNFLNANALHDSVTIPAREQVEKYVFFPRSDIFGAWGLDLPMRVMALKQERTVQLEGTVQVVQQRAEVTDKPQPTP
jgi:hypothetical protein